MSLFDLRKKQSGTTINNEDKTITANGEYTADEGYTGLGTVSVNVPDPSVIKDSITRSYSDDVNIVKPSVLNSNLTQYGGNFDISTGVYTGGQNCYLYTSQTTPLSTADNWEFQTKYTFNGGGTGYIHILGYSNGGSCQAPLFLTDTSYNLYLEWSYNGSSWVVGTGRSSLTLTNGTTYYFKTGFDGTKYYITYNLTGWEDTFTEIFNYPSTTKCYCNKPLRLMDGSESPSTDWSGGTMDLSQTKLYINGSLWLQAATESEQIYP